MKTELSEYAKFHFCHLGYLFKNLQTGQILGKGQFYELRKTPGLDSAWERIEYKPLSRFNGREWQSDEEKSEHFTRIAEVKKELQIDQGSE